MPLTVDKLSSRHNGERKVLRFETFELSRSIEASRKA